jgi:hypothetical protein
MTKRRNSENFHRAPQNKAIQTAGPHAQSLDMETKKMVIGFGLAVLGFALIVFAVVISAVIFPIGIPIGLITAIGGIASAWTGGKMVIKQLGKE